MVCHPVPAVPGLKSPPDEIKAPPLNIPPEWVLGWIRKVASLTQKGPALINEASGNAFIRKFRLSEVSQAF